MHNLKVFAYRYDQWINQNLRFTKPLHRKAFKRI